MASQRDDSIPEEAVRQRSYEIWLREQCPQGRQQEHWFRAKAELRSETLNRVRHGDPGAAPSSVYYWDYCG